MTQQDYTQHSITPPPELVQEWYETVGDSTDRQLFWKQRVATLQAAQWGADQELEACCEWIRNAPFGTSSDQLRAARRPKPPSLKEQALGAVGRFNTNSHTRADEMAQDFETIRRALEALPND